MTLDRALRVLLIEDNPLDARTVRRALQTADDGVELTHVDTLAAGLDESSSNLSDAILLDLSLPDSDGLDSLRSLIDAAPGTPIIVLTGLDDPEVAVRAVEAGAQDFLTKDTISPELIERALRYAIARHHAEAELRAATAQLDSLHTREEIARDLHDTVIQRLFAIGMSLQASASVRDADQLRARVEQAVSEIDDAIRDLRHAIFGLQASVEDVDTSTRTFTDHLAELVARHHDLSATYDVPAVLPVSEPVMHDLRAIFEEAVANAVRHGGAHLISFDAEIGDVHVTINVIDDGVGINDDLPSESSPLAGNGLRNMAARAARHGGSCTVASRGDRGTCVTVVVPRV